MKKTLIALLALGGMVMGNTIEPVWSMQDINLGTTANTAITLGGDVSLNTTDGYTAVITLNWTGVSNAPLFWLGTDDGSSYTNSTATVGYKGTDYHNSLFNTSGSNSNAENKFTGEAGALQDYISDVVKQNSKDSSLADKTLTFFLTSQNGTATLYSLDYTNAVVQIAAQTGMATGVVTGLHVGHWGTNASQNTGNMSIALYTGVMDTVAMQNIAGKIIPEPATATLSLLALAGLAARRRRK